MDETKTSTLFLEGLRQPGNEDAWRCFNQRYQPMLLNFARRCGISEADAPDVVQDCLASFVQAFREGRYDRDKGRLRSWLQGIAFNKIREARRRFAHREKQAPDRHPPDGGSDATAFLDRVPDERQLSDVFEQEWERGVLAECLQQARRSVDPQTFEAFELVALKGCSPERAAEQLGISRNAVYLCKSRVLSRLRQLQQEIAELW